MNSGRRHLKREPLKHPDAATSNDHLSESVREDRKPRPGRGEPVVGTIKNTFI